MPAGPPDGPTPEVGRVAFPRHTDHPGSEICIVLVGAPPPLHRRGRAIGSPGAARRTATAEPAGDAIQKSRTARPGNPPEQPDNPDRCPPPPPNHAVGRPHAHSEGGRRVEECRLGPRPRSLGTASVGGSVGGSAGSTTEAARPAARTGAFAREASTRMTGWALAASGTGPGADPRGEDGGVGRSASAARLAATGSRVAGAAVEPARPSARWTSAAGPCGVGYAARTAPAVVGRLRPAPRCRAAPARMAAARSGTGSPAVLVPHGDAGGPQAGGDPAAATGAQ